MVQISGELLQAADSLAYCMGTPNRSKARHNNFNLVVVQHPAVPIAGCATWRAAPPHRCNAHSGSLRCNSAGSSDHVRMPVIAVRRIAVVVQAVAIEMLVMRPAMVAIRRRWWHRLRAAPVGRRKTAIGMLPVIFSSWPHQVRWKEVRPSCMMLAGFGQNVLIFCNTAQVLPWVPDCARRKFLLLPACPR